MTDQNLSTRDIASERPNEADEPLAREEQDGAEREPLLPSDQSREFTGRWQEIQTGFVDEPRTSVENSSVQCEFSWPTPVHNLLPWI